MNLLQHPGQGRLGDISCRFLVTRKPRKGKTVKPGKIIVKKLAEGPLISGEKMPGQFLVFKIDRHVYPSISVLTLWLVGLKLKYQSQQGFYLHKAPTNGVLGVIIAYPGVIAISIQIQDIKPIFH